MTADSVHRTADSYNKELKGDRLYRRDKEKTRNTRATRRTERRAERRKRKNENRRTPFSCRLDFPSLRGKKKRLLLVRQMVPTENVADRENFGSRFEHVSSMRIASWMIVFECQKTSADWFGITFVWIFGWTKTISKERRGSTNESVRNPLSLVHL